MNAASNASSVANVFLPSRMSDKRSRAFLTSGLTKPQLESLTTCGVTPSRSATFRIARSEAASTSSKYSDSGMMQSLMLPPKELFRGSGRLFMNSSLP